MKYPGRDRKATVLCTPISAKSRIGSAVGRKGADHVAEHKTALIFTGGFCDTEALSASDLQGDLIIAADAGWITAQKCGLTPHILAGDFDSSDIPTHIKNARLVRVPAEKNDTDTMLACDLAIEQGAREIRIIGGTGGRLDHTLSNLFLLEKLIITMIMNFNI